MYIKKALIIRRNQVKLSIDFAKVCADSCEKYNLPYEYIDAIEFMDCDTAFKTVGAYKKEQYTNTQGNCCCHASHIKCWKRITELNEACIILEHDAVVLGDVMNIDIPDMSVVTFGNRVSKLNEYKPPRPADKLLQIERSIGVHACGLTPTTAKWLYDEVCENGAGPGVDRWLMMQRKSGLPLYICEPPQVVCWDRCSTSNFSEKDINKSTYSEKSRVHNYNESLTEGWKEGLRNA